MQTFSLCEPCRKRTLTVLPLILVLLLGAALVGSIGAGLIIVRPAEPGLEWLAVLTGVGGLLFSALFFCGAFWLTADAQTQIIATEAGIEKRVFGNPRVHIPWDELAEVGIALEAAQGRGGPYFSLYFSAVPLNPLRRAAHSESDAERGTEISVDCRNVVCTDGLEALCPLPLPRLKRPGDTLDYDLLAYRREHTPDGGWGAPDSDWLMDASGFLRRWHQAQKQKKQNRDESTDFE